MTVLIIEDELPAAERLCKLIIMYDDRILIKGPLESNIAILDWFKHNEHPDLIFSDIELLDGSVFNSLEAISFEAPIIFTTAYDRYALEAFKTNGISYLLKPFETAQFNGAMDKFELLKKSFQSDSANEVIAILKNLDLSQDIHYKTRLNVKIGKGMYLLNVDDIACIKTDHGIAYASKQNGKDLPLSNTISELQNDLNPAVFHRINRGEIININFIEKVETYFNDRLAVTVRGQKKLLVSSAGRTPEFRKWLKQ